MRIGGSLAGWRLVVCATIAVSGAEGPRAEGFVSTGSMGGARARAAAVLAGGKALVAGGSAFAGVCLPVDTAEVYDPDTGLFSPAMPMTQTRCGASAVTLNDGRVLIVGGFGSGIDDAELYDPVSGMFAPAGPLLRQRGGGFTLTLLADGRVLVAGGTDITGTTDVAELFDPATGVFSPAGTMTTQRFLHSATRLPDGRVLLAGGGADTTCAPVAGSAEIFDPADGSFAATSTPPVASLWGHAAAPLPDGTVLLAGGDPTCGLGGPGSSAALVYDPAAGAFAGTGDMGAIHGTGLAATALPDGRVLVAGGLDDGSSVATGDLYLWQARGFVPAGTMVEPRSSHAQVLLPDGTVLLAGGDVSPATTTGSAELYEPPPFVGTDLTARVDVVPPILHARSRIRWITVFVAVPGHEAGEVDVESVALRVDGGAPLVPDVTGRGSGDHDGDGVSDLRLRFSREAIEGSLTGTGETTLTVTGTLRDGTRFSGDDTLLVIAVGGASSSRKTMMMRRPGRGRF